tara:strand:+ start:5488 stop:5811 length:324 start_codon:yes stop_codon:yes gene_type:complete
MVLHVGENMSGIERKSGWACLTCEEMHEDDDDAFNCCGVEVTISWSATMAGTVTVDCRSRQEWEEAMNADEDVVMVDANINGIDGEVNVDDYSVFVETTETEGEVID